CSPASAPRMGMPWLEGSARPGTRSSRGAGAWPVAAGGGGGGGGGGVGGGGPPEAGGTAFRPLRRRGSRDLTGDALSGGRGSPATIGADAGRRQRALGPCHAHEVAGPSFGHPAIAAAGSRATSRGRGRRRRARRPRSRPV